MTIIETPVTDAGQQLGTMIEAEGVAVYRDATGYLALDVPGRLTYEKAAALHALLGKVLGLRPSAELGAATQRP